MTISGLLFPHEFDDREAFEALRATQAAAEPATLMGWVIGTGTAAQLFGRVVILKIDDTQSRIGQDGLARRIAYTLTLAPFRGAGKPVGLFEL